jgi:cytochrome oxidase Cu insertion factor (SCO1/SenC/PrrC family)
MASRWMRSDIDFDQYRTGDCGMLVRAKNAALTVVVVTSLAMFASVTGGQQPAAPAAAVAAGPVVNDAAPDFSLGGATRYGLLKTPVTLSDYRGRTVVLAFFYQARTKG